MNHYIQMQVVGCSEQLLKEKPELNTPELRASNRGSSKIIFKIRIRFY